MSPSIVPSGPPIQKFVHHGNEANKAFAVLFVAENKKTYHVLSPGLLKSSGNNYIKATGVFVVYIAAMQ